VRKLILGGIAHQQIVKTTGVSSGTVSVIRRDIKAQMLLMRATGCVTVALLSAKGRLSEVQKSQEKIGGPTRAKLGTGKSSFPGKEPSAKCGPRLHMIASRICKLDDSRTY
jgi:hypothetical protein